jgi:hypothetical protein
MGAFFVYTISKQKNTAALATVGRKEFKSIMDEVKELETIKSILTEKEKIINNPFAAFPNNQCLKALKILEEYSEEITDLKGL